MSFLKEFVKKNPFIFELENDELLANKNIAKDFYPSLDFFKQTSYGDLENFVKTSNNLGVKIPIYAGFDEEGKIKILNLAKTSSILVCGQTGFGKTNLMRQMLLSLVCFSDKSNVRVSCVDFNKHDFYPFRHCLEYVQLKNWENFGKFIDSLFLEMSFRNEKIKKLECSSIEFYNKIVKNKKDKLNYLVIFIEDIFKDVDKDGKKFIKKFASLMSECRSVGIRFILTFQYASSENLTTNLLQNVNTVFALHCKDWVAEKVNTREQKPIGCTKLPKGEFFLIINGKYKKGKITDFDEMDQYIFLKNYKSLYKI